jgi:RING finger/CHY zinc finger protein 1
MPDEYKDLKINVLCNDCNKKSEVLFHVVGSKCTHCRSYNTSRVGAEK